MSKQLPAQPNLRHLRNQAKALHKSYQDDKADAIACFEAHHPQSEKEAFSLQDAQLVVARSYSFPSWPNLVAEVEARLAEIPAEPAVVDPHELLAEYDLGPKIILDGAHLEGSTIDGLKLRDANLRNADLRNADLTNAEIIGANFENTDLSGTNLSGAELTGANLSGHDFSNLDLAGIK